MPFTLTHRNVYIIQTLDSGLQTTSSGNSFQMLCSSLEEILSTRGKSNAAFGSSAFLCLVNSGDLDLWVLPWSSLGQFYTYHLIKTVRFGNITYLLKGLEDATVTLHIRLAYSSIKHRK